MQLKFTKMQGLGNDFIVFDAINQRVELSPEQVRQLADRRFGIGCDQLLLVEAPEGDADFRYRIFNADGGEVEQCGNGARCFARFVSEQGLSDQRSFRVETQGGLIVLQLVGDDRVRVDMGVPNFAPAALPFEAEAEALDYILEVNNEQLVVGAVSMGNPHTVLRVEDIAAAPVERLGPLLESHLRFPRRVNVGFMQVVDASHINLRVFERGAGETLACGTGACAAVAVGRAHQWLGEQVHVQLPGGELLIEWAGPGQPLYMTGDAVTVFEGAIEL